MSTGPKHDLLEEFTAWLPSHKHQINDGSVGSDCIHEFLNERGHLPEVEEVTLESAVTSALTALVGFADGETISITLTEPRTNGMGANIDADREHDVTGHAIASAQAILEYASKMATVEFMQTLDVN